MQNEGISLIWVSALLTILGILLAASLPTVGNSGPGNATETLRRMGRIEGATRGFMAANGRRPCPADLTRSRTNIDFASLLSNLVDE